MTARNSKVMFAILAVLLLLATVIVAGVLMAGDGQNDPYSPPASGAGASETTPTPPPVNEGAGPPGNEALAEAGAGTAMPVFAAPKPVIPLPIEGVGLAVRAPPMDMPLTLHLPSLQVTAPVMSVGLTGSNRMDAPGFDDMSHKVYWYRGGSLPGYSGTATLAGHSIDAHGKPSIFINLEKIKIGDPVIVTDMRSGLNINFTVTGTEVPATSQDADTALLARIYGEGPVTGKGPLPDPEGKARLTLVTCVGTWVPTANEFDRRLIVYAERVD